MSEKLLIAVITCEARKDQADAQRATWVQDVDPDWADVRFFRGGRPDPNDYRLVLPVDDSYAGLPAKVKAVMAWSGREGYNGVLKLDDDVYLVPRREQRSRHEAYDYVGNFRSPTGRSSFSYASGFSYRLSRSTASILSSAMLTEDTMEDRHTGSVLESVLPPRRLDEKRYSCTFPCGIDHPAKLWSSAVGRSGIAFAQYPAEQFKGLHTWYRRVFHVSF